MRRTCQRGLISPSVTFCLAMGLTAVCALCAPGCAKKAPPQDPKLMALANTPATPRDPAGFAGRWTGQVHHGGTSGTLEMNVEVDGEKFSGTLATTLEEDELLG